MTDLVFRIRFLLLVMITVSCSEGDKDQEMLFWSSNNAQEILFCETVIEEWNRSHPDNPIKFQPIPEGQSSEEIILSSVVGGSTPDIYANMWQGDVELYAQAGVLVPLDTLDGFYEFIYDRTDSAVVEEIRSLDGHIYQLPWKINPIMLSFNRRILRDSDLQEPPYTYSQYMEACKEFSVDNDGDGYVDQWFGYTEPKIIWYERLFNFYPLYLAASGGGSLISGNKVAFDNEHAVEVFRFLNKLYKEKYYSLDRLTARQDPFISGEIATQYKGPWEITHVEKFANESIELDFAQVPVPDGHEGPVYTYGDPKNVVIFSNCKDPQTAFDFLSWMMNAENDLRFMKISTEIPRRKDLLEHPGFVEFLESSPQLMRFAQQAKYVKGTDKSPNLKEVFDIISQEYEACVLFDAKTPEQAIADAAYAVDLLLKK